MRPKSNSRKRTKTQASSWALNHYRTTAAILVTYVIGIVHQQTGFPIQDTVLADHGSSGLGWGWCKHTRIESELIVIPIPIPRGRYLDPFFLPMKYERKQDYLSNS